MKLIELKKFRFSDLFSKSKIKAFINYEKDLARNPKKLALSFAVGIFIGLSVPMGIQTIVALPFAVVLRCNIPVVYLATLISNPLTVIFLYTAMFKVGEFITGNYLPYPQVENILMSFSIQNLGQIGDLALKNYLIGMITITAVLSPISYFLILLYINRKQIKFFRKRTGEKKYI
jgi:uncharacterized protein (DUF2062 family)